MTEGKKGSMKPEQVVAQAVAEGGQQYLWAGRGNPPRARNDFHNEDILRFAPDYDPDRDRSQDHPKFVGYCKLLHESFGDQNFKVEQAIGLFTAQRPKRLNDRRESVRWMIESGRLAHKPRKRA